MMKQSEMMQVAIQQNRAKIAENEKRISELQRKLLSYRAGKSPVYLDRDAVQTQIISLQQGIEHLLNSIKVVESNLPRQIELDRVMDNIETDAAAKQRQQLAAEASAHAAAVKAAALAEWLRVPGQTAQGLETAWPSIATQIATQAAVTAGAVESEVKHHADPMRKIAEDLLAAKYGNLGRAQAGAVVRTH